MEPTQMLSVGIDIGTSTSQVIFSRLTVENTAGYFSVPAVSIIGKEVVYQSPVHRTPLIDESLIDGEALRKMIETEYASAKITANQDRGRHYNGRISAQGKCAHGAGTAERFCR